MADYEVWKREEGYWYGEYTFLGAEGDPYISSSWNYPYDHYYGFIHIELNGNALKQRNVFIYPPQTAEKCEADDSTEGDGVCGVNGNEKVFGADQEASDCEGNLAGPYTQGGFTLDTTTTVRSPRQNNCAEGDHAHLTPSPRAQVLGDDTVIYSVRIPDSMGGGINQNQHTKNRSHCAAK